MIAREPKGMAACHPRQVVQHLRLQEPGQIGIGVGVGVGSQGQKSLQQPHYSPHLLNWVYLAITDQNRAQPPPDQGKLLPPAIWNGFPTTTSQPYLHRAAVVGAGPGGAGAGARARSSPCGPLGGNLTDSIGDLADHFTELGLLDRKPTKRPPPSYLCHLCFKKGHYIKDCPEVSVPPVAREQREGAAARRVVFARRGRRARVSRRTRATTDASASTSVPSANANGCRATAGQIWAKSA
nr:zinc finger CCHC domain-containing protein 24-like [Megalopta genalis]